MKILIIYANPKHEGHCVTILNEIENNLQKNTHGINHDYEIIDLYKVRYDPVLKESEFYGSGVEHHKIIRKDTLIYQEKIKNADLLMFIYPVWWNTMPAVLKGFFDRVFSAGFAYKYHPIIPKTMMPFFEKIFHIIKNRFDFGIPEGLLKDKKATVFMTTGSPKYLSYFVNGSRFKKIIKKDTLGFFGIKSKIYHFGTCIILNEYKIAEIKKVVKKSMERI